MADFSGNGSAYVACIPHVPFMATQEHGNNPVFWGHIEERIAEFEAFKPDLVIAFGADHYSHIHLDRAPTFMIGHAAEAGDDYGGFPGKLDVPMDLTVDLAHTLVDQDFDITNSYQMKVDHGFSNVLGIFLRAKMDSVPVIPIHVNCMTEPRPSLRRVRQLAVAVGRWAAKLDKRVAFLGSGGLSHDTSGIFPQFRTAPDEKVRTFLVQGGTEGGITDHEWHSKIANGMTAAIPRLVAREAKTTIVRDWDVKFLDAISGGDLSVFDSWTDADMVREGGAGAGEIRTWLAAAAAGAEAGAAQPVVDFYTEDNSLAVGIGVVHASPRELVH